MSRPKGSFKDTPRYERKNGYARVRIAGCEHSLGKADTPESWEKYYRLCAEAKARGSMSGVDPNQITVKELCAAFIEYHQLRLGLDAWKSFQNVTKLLLKPYGSLPCVQFGPLRLKAIREIILERKSQYVR